MKLRSLLLLGACFLLAGCGLSDQQKVDYAAVERSGVSPAIYDKMVHGDDLSVGDVGALARAGVNQGIILRYLRDQDSGYVLGARDVDLLHRDGVSDSIIDYMLRSAENYYDYPPVSIGLGFGFPYDDGFYGGYRGGYRGGYGYHHWH